VRNEDPAHASRPFDRDRDGFVMGEAAVMLVLEERSAARDRGATAIAELLGFGASNDAYHMTAPRPDGRDAARAIRTALADASIGPERIGYVNAHASSTPLNEPAEARAIGAAFGVLTERIAVSGTKGLYGHALGASGAVEAAITALALERGILPGTCNLEVLDPTVELDVLLEARTVQVDAAVTNSFGFGGMNAALVIGRA
jgi:3-oxoacyl-[acyl-carrier-protein] synthase II